MNPPDNEIKKIIVNNGTHQVVGVRLMNEQNMTVLEVGPFAGA